MKNFVFGAICALAILCLGWVFGQVIENKGWPNEKATVEDTIVFDEYCPALQIECLHEVLSSEYANVQELNYIHKKIVEELTSIEKFRELPETTLQNVANVLLRTRPRITIPDILDEYSNNANIYDNVDGLIPLIPATDSTKSSTAVQKPADPTPVAEQKQPDTLSQDSTTKTRGR